MIYILKHKEKGFTGMCGHVWFENGRGSTSDKSDADFCVKKLGCEDITKEWHEKKAKEEAMKKAREAKEAKAKAKTEAKSEEKAEEEAESK